MPNEWPGRVKRIREEKGLSRAKLAKEAKLSASTIARLEEGKSQPVKRTRRKLLRAINKITGQSYKIEEFFKKKQ